MNNVSTISSHCDLNSPKGLKSLWIEIPDHCHLKCDYCFASTERDKPKRGENYMQINDYINLIEQFAAQGGEFIGIPGRGEPFHPGNEKLVRAIVSKASKHNLTTTIFTTGDTLLYYPKLKIDENKEYDLCSEKRKSDKEDLINFLGTRNVILLIKYNSAKDSVQDNIVNTHNYTKYREEALKELEQRLNEHKDDTTWNLKIGVVTSILGSNKDEIATLYERFNPQNGYIFDCDTILPRGRGEYYKRNDNLSYEDLNKTFALLKKKGAIQGCQGGTYVGISCDRIFHHLYISLSGDVYPCIGCFENRQLKTKLRLGNIKDTKLADLNNHYIKAKLRETPQEAFVGVCSNCQNFKDKICFSCLGRCASEVTVSNNDILIDTIGCTNHRPILSEWINQSVDYLRTILSYGKTKKLLDENLEELWRPNQNLAFKLHQLCKTDQEQEICKILEVEDAHDRIQYNPDKNHSQNPVERFSLKKHYKYSDLYFPLNKVWDFIKQPPIICKDEKDKEKLISEFSKSYLSNIFLSSLKILIEKHDCQNYDEINSVLACNIMLYDNDKKQYFYRTISKGEMESDSKFRHSLILFRWAENIGKDNYFSAGEDESNKGVIFNASSILRNEFYKEYELILERNNHQISESSDNKFDFTSFIASDLISEKVNELDKFFQDKVFNKNGYWDKVEPFINTKRFSDIKDNQAKAILIELFKGLNACLFSSEDRELIKSDINSFKLFILDNCRNREIVREKLNNCITLDELQRINGNKKFQEANRSLSRFFELLKEDKEKGEEDKSIIHTYNYIVFLGYLHKLGINYYTLFHSSNFKNVDKKYAFITADSYGYSNIINPSGILICSKNKLNRDFRSDLSLLISNIFQPLDEYYFNKLIHRHKSMEEHLKAHQHTIFNLFPHIKYNLLWIEKEVDEILKKNNIEKAGCELDQLVREEAKTLSILDFILKDSLKSKRKDNNCLSHKSYIDIIKDVCEYCRLLRESSNEKSNIQIQCVEKQVETYKPQNTDAVDVFTVFYNLMINANKASFYKHLIDIQISLLKDNKLRVSIENYGIPLDQKIIDFINDPDKYSPPRPDSGLAIVRTKVGKLGWSIKANRKEDTSAKSLLRRNEIEIEIPLTDEKTS